MSGKESEQSKPKQQGISLDPMPFDEAVSDLLKVRPPPKKKRSRQESKPKLPPAKE
jgi:hypothetical protein